MCALLLLLQGSNWATANVDAPSAIPSAAESPMVNKVRSDISNPRCRTQALLGFHPVLILCHLQSD
jgi:hypothetical protein